MKDLMLARITAALITLLGIGVTSYAWRNDDGAAGIWIGLFLGVVGAGTQVYLWNIKNASPVSPQTGTGEA